MEFSKIINELLTISSSKIVSCLIAHDISSRLTHWLNSSSLSIRKTKHTSQDMTDQSEPWRGNANYTPSATYPTSHKTFQMCNNHLKPATKQSCHLPDHEWITSHHKIKLYILSICTVTNNYPLMIQLSFINV